MEISSSILKKMAVGVGGLAMAGAIATSVAQTQPDTTVVVTCPAFESGESDLDCPMSHAESDLDCPMSEEMTEDATEVAPAPQVAPASSVLREPCMDCGRG